MGHNETVIVRSFTLIVLRRVSSEWRKQEPKEVKTRKDRAELSATSDAWDKVQGRAAIKIQHQLTATYAEDTKGSFRVRYARFAKVNTVKRWRVLDREKRWDSGEIGQCEGQCDVKALKMSAEGIIEGQIDYNECHIDKRTIWRTFTNSEDRNSLKARNTALTVQDRATRSLPPCNRPKRWTRPSMLEKDASFNFYVI